MRFLAVLLLITLPACCECKCSDKSKAEPTTVELPRLDKPAAGPLTLEERIEARKKLLP
jgi:hypothetical protein